MVELIDTLFICRFFNFMKKQTRGKLVKELDNIFSRYIRLRDCNRNWIVVCPLCWAKIPRKKAQNMHFISRGVMRYRYNEENCHAGCMRCNVILNWNYIEYTLYMINKYWKTKVEEMRSNKQVYKIGTPEIKSMIEYYSEEVINLARKKWIEL